MDISPMAWKHALYNSDSHGEKGTTWNAFKQQTPYLEQLIRLASGFPVPLSPSTLVLGTSAQQANSYDCGIISVHNALGLLSGNEPSLDVNTDGLRLAYASQVLQSLRDGLERDGVPSQSGSPPVPQESITEELPRQSPSPGASAPSQEVENVPSSYECQDQEPTEVRRSRRIAALQTTHGPVAAAAQSQPAERSVPRIKKHKHTIPENLPENLRGSLSTDTVVALLDLLRANIFAGRTANLPRGAVVHVVLPKIWDGLFDEVHTLAKHQSSPSALK
jgi:hypothetical protein